MDHETFPQNAPGAATPDALPDDRTPGDALIFAAHPAPDPMAEVAWHGSGDPDDPTAGLTTREYTIYWRGAIHAAREDPLLRGAAAQTAAAGRDAGHAPAEIVPAAVFPADLPSGVADIDARTAMLAHGGWTPPKRRVFLEQLAAHGVVARACRAVAISARGAYDLRNRDAIFAAGWRAALGLARQRLADELYERALRGQVERVVHDGRLIERHRIDNRLAMAVLTRLDRQCAAPAGSAPDPHAAPPAHAVLARHWPAYLDAVAPSPPCVQRAARDAPQESGGAADLADAGPGQTRSPASDPLHGDSHTREVGALHREDREVGAPHREDREVGALHREEREVGAPDHEDREAGLDDLAALLARLAPPEPPADDDAADGGEEAGEDAGDGADAEDAEDDGEDDGEDAAEVEDDGHDIWQDESGAWRTDYPPPPGFTGWQSGTYGDVRYERALDPDESAVAARWEAEDAEDERAAHAAAEHCRRAAFGL